MIALGGNALSPKGEAGTIYQQFSHTRESLDAIMHFVNLEYNICLTHGNGPQVGDELYRMELTYSDIPPLPIPVEFLIRVPILIDLSNNLFSLLPDALTFLAAEIDSLI